MITQKTKIVLNILLFISLILIVLGLLMNQEIHKLFGTIFIILAIIHILYHLSWIKSIPSLLKKKS